MDGERARFLRHGMARKQSMSDSIAVVIPSFRVTRHILGVISRIGSDVNHIYVVDDKCPDNSGNFVRENCRDPRVKVIYHIENEGVGGAVMTGYKAAISDGASVIVKIDGDGQMDPGLIPVFVRPILDGHSDYTKGNRFFNLEQVRAMPPLRLFGNAMLSFMTKLSSGYWDIFDPTNGYTAIHAEVVLRLPLNKISRRYFFESDMLFRLNAMNAVVVDVPMDAIYGDESSNLKISKIVTEFLGKNIKNFFKRLFYNYYLRNLSLASIELPLGVALIIFGTIYGGAHWLISARTDAVTPAGTVILAALPILMGMQLILAFLAHDISSLPRYPIHKKLFRKRPGA
jgi:dolichol-phosphate mannosyltransferase